MRSFISVFNLLLICFVSCYPVSGQLTSNSSDGRTAATYTNPHGSRDTIFVFNQTPQERKGNLSLQYFPVSDIVWEIRNPVTSGFEIYKTFTDVTRCSIDTLRAGEYRITVTNDVVPEKTILVEVKIEEKPDETYHITVTSDDGYSVSYDDPESFGKFSIEPLEYTFHWYRFDYDAVEFEKIPFATVPDVKQTSMNGLEQGGYKVTVTLPDETIPCDSFVSWIYLNPGFELKMLKNDNGEVMYAYKYCTHTDFLIDNSIPVVQSSFTYYDPVSKRQGRLDNEIKFIIRRSSGEESIILQSQGGQQYFRDYYPPYEDMMFYFKGTDMFNISREDHIYYETIIPHAQMKVALPEIQPNSAPVDARFTSESRNATEYLWRFGDGDSVMYDLENLMPDTVKHTYYTAGKTYTAILFVTSLSQCTDSVQEKITVSPPSLVGANVFTPNGDTFNDYFKLENTSIRNFEISIYTRTGKRVYHYKGSDLRNWEGWDGRIQNTGKDAAEGVYFWVIDAVDWADPPNRYGPKANKTTFKEVYKGVVHLYR